MAGGAVGYVAYDAARWFEPVLTKDLRPAEGVDDAVFMLFRTVLAFDRVRQQIEITSCVMTEEAGESRERLRELYDAAVAETERVERLLSEGTAAPARVDESVADENVHASFESNWSREEFESAVVKIKEHIAAGDCYQAVLSQRFSK
jgi:anthranilate synthase component 1